MRNTKPARVEKHMKRFAKKCDRWSRKDKVLVLVLVLLYIAHGQQPCPLAAASHAHDTIIAIARPMLIAFRTSGVCCTNPAVLSSVETSMYSGVPRHKWHVRTVSFQNCEDVTCQTIEAVAEHCPRLQGLDLYGCTQVPVLFSPTLAHRLGCEWFYYVDIRCSFVACLQRFLPCCKRRLRTKVS